MPTVRTCRDGVTAADEQLAALGKALGHPARVAILRRLSGKTHRVLTAVAVAFEGRIESVLSVSNVRFGDLDEADIRRYVASGEPMDKAGAYAIQGIGALFIEAVQGSFSTVMGLPVERMGALFGHLGLLKPWMGFPDGV